MLRLRSIACLLLCGAAWAAHAQPAPQQKLNTTRSQLQQTAKQEAALKKQLEQTQRALHTMQQQATELASSLQQTERETNRAERELTKAEQSLSATEKDFAARKAEYAHTVAGLLRMRQLPPTAMFNSDQDMKTMLRTGRAMQLTNAALAARASELRDQLARLERLKREAANRSQEVARSRSRLSRAQAELNRELAARQTLQQRLQRDHEAAVARTRQLSRESASLQELIGKLEQARSTPQFAPKAAAIKPAGALASARGRLKLPVVGTVQSRFGDRKNANETYRGLLLGTRSGATVVAPYQGEVVFTGPFMDYGRMVLLKHGDGYITLLAGLGSISVGLNQRLSTGEPLGTMPATNPKLYVELRERSKPIDPAGWFANLPKK